MPPSILHSLILGIVQGLAEFLPISSSAHLILLPRFMKWEDPGLAYDVALHLGTLVGLLAYYWKELCAMVVHFDEPAQRKTFTYLILATIPGALAGVLLEHKAETVFRSPVLIGTVLIILGALLALADWTSKNDTSIADMTWRAALAIGIAQSFALIPGVSRSGITITVALFLGLERREAARFSFLMSIPIIAGAGLLKSRAILHSPDILALGVGFAGAAVAGLFAIWFLFKIIQTRHYIPFAIYRWVLGLFVLLNLAKFQ